jgi:hypothetical protein
MTPADIDLVARRRRAATPFPKPLALNSPTSFEMC